MDPGFFSGGGGGGSRPDDQKTVWTAFLFVLVLNLFYSLQRGPMVLLKRKLYFSKDPEGVQHFPGGGGATFSAKETHVTCDFPGVSGPPILPSGSTHVTRLGH